MSEQIGQPIDMDRLCQDILVNVLEDGDGGGSGGTWPNR